MSSVRHVRKIKGGCLWSMKDDFSIQKRIGERVCFFKGLYYEYLDCVKQ